jgi:hypothetical protein
MIELFLCEHNNFVVINLVFSKDMDYGLPILPKEKTLVVSLASIAKRGD